MMKKIYERRIVNAVSVAVLPALFLFGSAFGPRPALNNSGSISAHIDTTPQLNYKQSDMVVIVGYAPKESDVAKQAAPEIKKPTTADISNSSSFKEKIVGKPDTDPSYPEGDMGWKRFLNRNIRYPRESMAKNSQGLVVVGFIVDKEGKLADVQAIGGVEDENLRKMAVETVKKGGNWVPAIDGGVAVNSYKTQPMTFKLEPRAE